MRDGIAKRQTHGLRILYPTSPQTRGRRMVAPLMTSKGTQMTRVENNSVRGSPWIDCMCSYMMAVWCCLDGDSVTGRGHYHGAEQKAVALQLLQTQTKRLRMPAVVPLLSLL
jgi:hypothetical protein